MSKRVLIISYFSQTERYVVSTRIKGLMKYLPEFGWEPIVLTALVDKPNEQLEHQNSRIVHIPDSKDLSGYLKRKLGFQERAPWNEVISNLSSSNAKKRSFLIFLISFAYKLFCKFRALVLRNRPPDEKKHWKKYALKVCEKLLKEQRIDAVISTHGPAVGHLVAHEIKKKYNTPWIADFRDLWTQNHYYYSTYKPIKKFFERKLEIRTLSNADILTTVSLPLAKKLEELHKGKDVFAITNGFDPEEVVAEPLTKEFTITYTGALYQGKQDPTPLFEAVSELIKRGVMDPEMVKIRFFGYKNNLLKEAINFYRLENVTKICGYIPRSEALKHQRSSQILLLLNWNDPREDGVYTGKLFEYLAARRPILAIGGPGGVVADLLSQTKAGVHTSKLDELTDILSKWYQEWKETGQVSYRGISEEINKYNHREMARKFAQLLESITVKSVERR